MRKITALLAGILLAAAGLLFMERPARRVKTKQPGPPPRIAFAVAAGPKARLGERIWLRFSLTNLGDTPIRSLALQGMGDWEAFHVEVVDVDGVFERRDGLGWFLLGQEVPPGKKREPLIGLLPKAAGTYRFVFYATDGRGSEPLPNARGEPAKAECSLTVMP
jgi:hypothetical protein